MTNDIEAAVAIISKLIEEGRITSIEDSCKAIEAIHDTIQKLT